ncbi:MFS transporter [Dactylosporangium sp. CA-233914]|uniref:MFS transporter n=1 Tax=Dactylosporangium sp. CA-233914 TaxID=3239934 RepID=UPI003D909DEC
MVVSVAQLMVVLDTTIVNIALPSAQADLDFPDSQRHWIITAYALAFGSLLLLGGRVGDRTGRKRTFLIALIAFAAASALGGAAPSFAVLVIARAVQGAAAALLAPAALGTLATTFTDVRDRGKAFALFGTVAVSGGAVGLIFGGILTEYLSWRWCMYVNVLFAAGAALAAKAYMVHAKPSVRPHLDIAGTVLAVAGLFGLVFGLSQVEAKGWTDRVTLTSLAVGVVLLITFSVVERRVPHPLLPLRIVVSRLRGMAFVAVGFVGLTTFSLNLFLSYYLQNVKHLSPLNGGLAFLPMIVCIMISSNVSNRITLPMFGPRVIVTVGLNLSVVALGYLSLLRPASSYEAGVLPGLVVMGLALGMVMPPSMNTATLGVEPRDAGAVAALVSTMQQIGGAVGVAVTSVIAASATSSYLSRHPGRPNLEAAAAVRGYGVVFGVLALLAAVAGLLATVLSPRKIHFDAMHGHSRV